MLDGQVFGTGSATHGRSLIAPSLPSLPLRLDCSDSYWTPRRESDIPPILSYVLMEGTLAVVFRLLVTFAFITRLLTGCCAGGCPVATAHGLGTASNQACPGCDDPDCCEHAACHHSHCCQPFGQDSCPHHDAPAEPCGCPGHSHHFCLGTHLFAVGVERCELPTSNAEHWGLSEVSVVHQVAIADRSVDGAQDDTLHTGPAQKMRAVLQVYVL